MTRSLRGEMERPLRVDRDTVFEIVAGGPEEGLQPAEVTLALGLERDRRAQVRRVLQQLVRRGALRKAGRRYAITTKPPGRDSLVRGTLQVTPGGRGFVNRGDAYEDVIVAPEELAGAIDGDTVLVNTWPRRDGREQGAIVEVVERARKRVTGVLLDKPWRLETEDPRLPPIDVEPIKGRKTPKGQVVVAEITVYPVDAGQPLVARVEHVLGPPEHLSTELQRILFAHDVEERFPAEVLDEARRLPRFTEASTHADLRDLPFVTIDPETARDFDDAVTAKQLDDEVTRVWVAVADVSTYVAEGSALDTCAAARAFSIYLPDRAIPMLPERLSGDLCSLVPNQDRPAMVVRFDVDTKGRASNVHCLPSLIHSHARLDYKSVAAAFAGDFRGRRAGYREHLPQLELLLDVAQRLGRNRRRRGTLALDLPESQVVLHEDDPLRVQNICVSRKDPGVRTAYNLIEELMIAANEAVAQLFIQCDYPTLWRVHAPPAERAREGLAQTLACYGIEVDARDLTKPKGMARLLKAVTVHPTGTPLHYVVLRSLKQATYQAENVGHFGLGSPAYVHFTSPIRRYPDLVAHRLIKRLLAERRPVRGLAEQLSTIGARSSELERRAMDVERQVLSSYAAAFMRDKLGDTFAGNILSVTSFGFFVRLEEPAVEGLVKIETLPEYVKYDPIAHCLRGRSRVYALGDRVHVTVAGVALARRHIDFELVQHRQSMVPQASDRKRGRGKGVRERRGGKGGPRRGRGRTQHR